MAVEDKYLKETIRSNISNDKRYRQLVNLANDLDDYGKKMYDLIFMEGFGRLGSSGGFSFVKNSPREINKELNRRKMELIKIRNRALTQDFKNIVDEYIEFINDILEGYWENVDTSREGT